MSSRSITRKGKSEAMQCEKSDEVIVPMIAGTTQPCIGKDLCFDRALKGGTCT